MAKISFNARMGQRFRKITSDYCKINQYVHETAMLILAHAQEHKDCSTAQGLINAMPQSARKLALINWFGQFSPIVVKDDDKWQSKMHKEGTKLYVPFDLEGAAANPWFTLADKMGAEKGPLTFEEMVKLVEGLSKRINKKIEDGEVEPESIESGKAIVRVLSGLHFEKVAPANEDAAPAAKKAA